MNRLDHIVSTNFVDNELKFYGSNSLANNHINNPLPIMNIILRGGKKSRQVLNSGLTFLWDIGAIYSMIKRKLINNYKSKLRANRIKHSMGAVLYKNIHDVKIQFIITCLSVGLVFESHSLLILGWWSYLPRASAILTLDSVPMFKYLCITVRDGSGPLLYPPSNIHPGSLPSRASFPSPLSFRPFCLLSVHIRVFSRPYLAASYHYIYF